MPGECERPTDTFQTGVAKALVASLQRYAVDTPSMGEGGQTVHLRRARHAKTPEYFSEFRERPDITSFLGACIYAKVSRDALSSDCAA